MAQKDFLSSHRNSYQHAKDVLQASGEYIVNDIRKATMMKKKNIRLAQSFLWSQIPINASNSQYIFNVLDNKLNVGTTNLLPQEKRLKQQDVFFCYKLGFYLVNYTTGGGVYQFQLQTYPSANFYGTGGCNLQSLLALWTSGVLQVTVNGEVLTPGWDLGQHLVIPQTQQPANPIAGSIFWDEIDLSNDGWVHTEPNWVLNGGNDNVYQVNYPNNFNLVTLGTQTWHLVMKWQGFLAQNASSIMDNGK